MWKVISSSLLFLVLFGFCFVKSAQATETTPAIYKTVTSVGKVWVYQNKEVSLSAKCAELGGTVDAQQSGCYVGGNRANISERYKCSDGAFVEAERLCANRSSWGCPDDSWTLVWASKTCTREANICETLRGQSSSRGGCVLYETQLGKGKGCDTSLYLDDSDENQTSWFIYTGDICQECDKETDPTCGEEDDKEGDDKDGEGSDKPGGDSSGPKGEASGNPGEKPGDGDGEDDGKGGNGSGTGEGDGSCPSWLGWLCGSGDGPSKPDTDTSNLPGKNNNKVDIGRLDTSDSFFGSRSCPAPRAVSFGALGWGEIEISYQPLCDIADYVRLVVIALAMIKALFILFGSSKE